MTQAVVITAAVRGVRRTESISLEKGTLRTMTQYCRYCTACHVANGNWCEIKEKELTDAQIKHSNKCRDFEFCSMDVYDENRTYQPRKKKPRSRFDSFQEDLFSMLMGGK